MEIGPNYFTHATDLSLKPGIGNDELTDRLTDMGFSPTRYNPGVIMERSRGCVVDMLRLGSPYVQGSYKVRVKIPGHSTHNLGASNGERPPEDRMNKEHAALLSALGHLFDVQP